MSKYSATTLTATAAYSQVVPRLTAMSAEDLASKIHHEMVAHSTDLIEAAWFDDEPEHEFLGSTLRDVINADLRVMYGGGIDSFCDEYLAAGIEPATGRCMLTVLFCNFERDHPHRYDNPVTRLRALGICDAEKAPSRKKTMNDTTSAVRALTDALARSSSTISSSSAYEIPSYNIDGPAASQWRYVATDPWGGLEPDDGRSGRF